MKYSLFFLIFLNVTFITNSIHSSQRESWKEFMLQKWSLSSPEIDEIAWEYCLPPGSYLDYTPLQILSFQGDTELNSLTYTEPHSPNITQLAQKINNQETLILAQAAAVGAIATQNSSRVCLHSIRVVPVLEKRIQELEKTLK